VGQIQAEQLKLLQAHYADAIPLDLLRKEQVRLADELETVQRALSQANTSRAECRAQPTLPSIGPSTATGPTWSLTSANGA
jgi:hypothetical protein